MSPNFDYLLEDRVIIFLIMDFIQHNGHDTPNLELGQIGKHYEVAVTNHPLATHTMIFVLKIRPPVLYVSRNNAMKGLKCKR